MKCDECGCGVKAEDIHKGGATRKYISPDSALSFEMYETICAKCNNPAPPVVSQVTPSKRKRKKREVNKVYPRCIACLEYKPLETKRHCAECAKKMVGGDSNYENQLRKQMGLPINGN